MTDDKSTTAIDDSERRRSSRAALDLLIQYRFANYDSFISSRTLDISTSGVFIRTETPLKEGDLICFQFRMDDNSAVIEGMGRVVRVNPPNTQGRVAGMGIEFLTLEGDSRKHIEEAVNRRIFEAQKKIGISVSLPHSQKFRK